ncbi:MAG: PAS domain S-box protein [Candidatus Brocadiae bacterium]|nr:PAS domain S-box protein [Candidatus Brocadiia bacterium]
MRLREKLSLGFLTLAAVVGMLGYASMTINADIETNALDLGTRSALEVKLPQDMALCLRTAHTAIGHVLMQEYRVQVEPDARPNATDDIRQAQSTLHEALRRFKQHLTLAQRSFDASAPPDPHATANGPALAQPLDTVSGLQRDLATYETKANDCIALAHTDVKAARQRIEEELDPLCHNQMLPMIEAFGTFTELARSRRARGLLQSVHQSNHLVMISTLVAFFFAAFLGLFLSGRISSPITKLTTAALEIGKGHLDTRVDVQRNDELGTLATTFNRMADDLSTTMVSKSYVDNILRSMGDTLIVTDREGYITRVNRALLTLLGYGDEELLGQPVNLVVAEKDRFGKTRIRESMLRDVAHNVETSYIHKDTRQIPVSLTVSAMYSRADKLEGIIFAAQDITLRREAEAKLLTYQEQLRSLAAHTSLAEERHRRRLATQLDDRIGDSLAVCKIKTGALREAATSPELAGELEGVRSIIDEVIQQARTMIFDLSSPILYELGIEAAIEELVQQAGEHAGIDTRFKDDGKAKPLGDAIRVVLFQSVRGLLHNVVDHARARIVEVSLLRHDQHVEVAVQDDGVGFNPDALNAGDASTRGGSLFEIRERLRYLGGRLEVKSDPGRGTQVRLVVPLRQRTPKDG